VHILKKIPEIPSGNWIKNAKECKIDENGILEAKL